MNKSSKLTLVFVAITVLVGLVCIYTGIALLVKANQPQESPASSKWSYSEEGKRIGLEKLLLKVQAKYFELYPNKIANKPGVSADEVKRKFKPYDPKPLRIKDITDSSRKLVEELENLQVSTEKLKQFEKRAIAQAKYWVYHVFPFGVPYGYDYYIGDWLLGPDIFSWSPICVALGELQPTLANFFQPITIEDLELVKVKIQEAGEGFETYVDNLRFGVSAGMVRNKEVCEDGKTSFASTFRAVHVDGEQGIVNDTYIKPLLSKDFMSKMKPEEAKQWEDKYGKTPKESLQEFFVIHLGRPIHQMLRYLEFNYSKHCVSSDISSGMSSLPLKYVYVNNQPTTRTTGVLPTGEPLDGKKGYRKLLSFWTTTGVTVEELYKRGRELAEKLSDELNQEARKFTGETDNEKAKASIMAEINKESNYFNTTPIPAKESNKEAYVKCISMETAKIHCPVRWQAMKNWLSFVKQLCSDLRYKIMKLFHFVGPKATVPNCPVEPQAQFNPAFTAASYQSTNAECTNPANYSIPFFQEKMGAKSEEWTISAHEMVPGHHLQIQGQKEYFSQEYHGVVKWISDNIFFLTFAEGWALYAENPVISDETDTYKDMPLMKFEVLKWRILPAVSFMLDVGLHHKGMLRDEALQTLGKYVWTDKERLKKSMTRYQSIPGQSISYMFGRLEILKIREKVKKKLGDKFKIKDFHFHLLRQGWAPLNHLSKAMDKYADCELKNDGPGCHEVLSPPKRDVSMNIVRNKLPKMERFLKSSISV